MNSNVENPLLVRCEYCGGDVLFDIEKQKYCCDHCGAEAGVAEKKAQYRRWKSIRREKVMKDISRVKSFDCPACGAQTIVSSEEVTAHCPFCQNTMIDSSFSGNDLPEVIIPFKLTKEEAEAKLRSWLKDNKNNDAAKVIEKNMQNFTGCYLPYHIVRGAYNSKLQISMHDGSISNYPFRAYLNHTAVNASKDLDNLFLDGIEPFDFDEALEFNFGYLNHQTAKLQNVFGEQLVSRIGTETKEELYKSISKKVHTKEMSVSLSEDENESFPALLPVYIVKCENGVAAAVNGQTGKISIATGKTKNLTRFWWVAPLLATVAVCVAGSYFADMELGFWGGVVFGIIFFAIASTRHEIKIVDENISFPKDKKTHNDTRVQFFANFGSGEVPVNIKFFTFGRIFKTVLGILSMIFLPVLIAVPLQLLRGQPISDIHILYGAAWYTIFGFLAIVAAGGLAKSMMYSVPLYYQILPNGKTKRVKKTGPKKRVSLKGMLSQRNIKIDGTIGCFLIGFPLFVLIGSVLAMIF